MLVYKWCRRVELLRTSGPRRSRDPARQWRRLAADRVARDIQQHPGPDCAARPAVRLQHVVVGGARCVRCFRLSSVLRSRDPFLESRVHSSSFSQALGVCLKTTLLPRSTWSWCRDVYKSLDNNTGQVVDAETVPLPLLFCHLFVVGLLVRLPAAMRE